MQDAQEVYNRILGNKTKLKELKKAMKEQYEQIPEYNDIQEEKKILRDKQKTITLAVDNQNPHIITQIEDLKIDIKSDQQLLTDIVIAKVTKGEKIELTDNRDQLVLPIFTVKYEVEK